MIEKFIHDGVELALVIRHSYQADGIEFFTPSDYSQQIGYMRHPPSHLIEPHVHNPVAREIHYTREVLVIRSGKIRVDLYTDDREYVESTVLNSGDIILLASGGHGFETLEETEMIEVKQGPYGGDDDKTRFDGVPESELKIRSEST